MKPSIREADKIQSRLNRIDDSVAVIPAEGGWRVEAMTMTDTLLFSLSEIEDIVDLYINCTEDVGEVNFELLRRCDRIRSCHLRLWSYSESALKLFDAFKELESVWFSMKGVSVRELWSALNKNSRLLSVSCGTEDGDRHVPRGVLRLCDAWPQLEELQLNRMILCDGFSELARLSRLRCLECCRAEVPPRAFQTLSTLNTLAVLDVSCTSFNDDNMSDIVQCTELQTLCLVNTAVTSRGCERLSELCKLEQLSVDPNVFNREVAMRICEMRSLKQLNIYDNIDRSLLRLMRQKRPDLEICGGE